jgi:hypothetical protein
VTHMILVASFLIITTTTHSFLRHSQGIMCEDPRPFYRVMLPCCPWAQESEMLVTVSRKYILGIKLNIIL